MGQGARERGSPREEVKTESGSEEEQGQWGQVVPWPGHWLWHPQPHEHFQTVCWEEEQQGCCSQKAQELTEIVATMGPRRPTLHPPYSARRNNTGSRPHRTFSPG